jgi:hypothetical protein
MFIDDFDIQIQSDEFAHEYEDWLAGLDSMWEGLYEEEDF